MCRAVGCRACRALTPSALIARDIASHGAVTFARFVELALYAPGCGYYTGGVGRVGRGGDFLTASSAGPAMGRVLARQFEEMWEVLGCPRPFALVEQGANDARILGDILDAARAPFLEAIECHVIEPFPLLAEAQRAALEGRGKTIFWHAGPCRMPPFTGVHFSNELVDALPFHLLVSDGSAWRELFVAGKEDAFHFRPMDLSGEAAPEAARLPVRPAGTLAEVRPAARRWIHEVANVLERGFLMVIDYGMTRDRLHDGSRPRGTFACHHGHRRDDLPLENPGTKDITAHVDFSALVEAGRDAGLVLRGLCDQCRFVTGAAGDLLREMEGQTDSPLWRGLKTLLHPDSMGATFHVLCLSTPMPDPVTLSGLRYARMPVVG
jgi:SAM-dependent MidA family methyltransferase